MSGSNRLAGLKARPKDTSPEEVRRVDEVGEALGFVDRSPRRKPGRKPSPRTYQLHPKVFPRPAWPSRPRPSGWGSPRAS